MDKEKKGYKADSREVGVGVVRALKTLSKSKIGVVGGAISALESESEESERFRLYSESAYDSFAYNLVKTRLLESGVRSRSARINQSQCLFPRFVIGLVLPLLLATPTALVSLDRKRRSHKGNIRTLFSLDHNALTLLITTPQKHCS